MPRRRCPPRLPRGDRDRRLAEEVMYLHSLWRRGPPAPAIAPIRSPRRKTTKRKRRKLERDEAAKPQDTEPEWPLAPSPPSPSPRTWPEAASASSPPPLQPPPPAPSPGSLAQREALRAAVEFFSSRASSPDDEDGDGSESENEQDAQDAAAFFRGLFERDAALRGHYERGWEDGKFACMVCAAGKRKAGRRFRGCVALVQHARAAARYGRPQAHRALAAVVCRVLGWVFERLPSVVIDPRGTLGQALASGAKADVQAAKVMEDLSKEKENDDAGENNGSSSDEDEEKDVETGTDGDEDANEPENSEGSAIKDDVETGMEDSSTDGDDEADELASNEDPAENEKEDIRTGMEGSKAKNKNTDGGKEAMELDDDENIAEKDHANKDGSLIQDNNGEVHEQAIAKESAEQCIQSPMIED